MRNCWLSLRKSVVPIFTWLACLGICHTATAQGDESPTVSALTILIGGLDSDPSPEQVEGTAMRGRGNSGMYQLRGDLLQEQVCRAEYFNWNGTRAGQLKQQDPPPSPKLITQFIREEVQQKPNCRIVIVGNSWGGHSAWEVCTQLEQEPAVPVEMLVFLDPSSAARANTVRPASLPKNVNQAVNYYTRNLFVWRNWPEEQRLTNIDLGDPAQGFLSPARPYDHSFNWQAHVLAEWDQRIHDDIRERIKKTVEKPVAKKNQSE